MTKEPKPKIAYERSMYYPQEFKNPFTAEKVMAETSLTMLCYGYGASGKMDVWNSEATDRIPKTRLLEDSISLALGIGTIKLSHFDTCQRLICNCKVH